MALSGKREAFCQEYVIDHNATKAALRAQYAEGSARQTGSRLLSNDDIKKRIAELEAEIVERNKLTADKVLEDIQLILDESIKSKDRKSALKALEMQGKYLKMFTDKVEHTGAVPVQIVDDIK